MPSAASAAARAASRASTAAASSAAAAASVARASPRVASRRARRPSASAARARSSAAVAGGLGRPAPRGLGLGRPGGLGASQRRELVAARPAGRAQRAELGQRLRQRTDPRRPGPPPAPGPAPGPARPGCDAAPRGRPPRRRARRRSAARSRAAACDLAGRPRLAQPERRQLGARRLVHHPTLALLLRAGRHRRRDLADGGLGRLERLERPFRLGAQGVPAALRLGRAAGGLVPASVGGGDQRGRQLLAGRAARRLLLGELAEAARLRSQLREDVLDPCEVGLGLGELLLGPPAPALVAADPGDLLEQRPALLGPQREGLVHHALADEQERVLGEVRAVEQVHEVAQADALPVEQVVVLAGAVEAAAELHDRVLDREQRVAVVEDEGDVGHALGAAAARSPPRSRPRCLRIRSERPCSPSAQRSASARLDLPDPLGPTTALIPAPNSTRVRSANDLNPWTRRPRRRAGALTGSPPAVPAAVRAERHRRRPARRGSAWAPERAASGPRRPVGPRYPRPSGADARPRPRGAAVARSRRSASRASAAADVSAIRRDGPSPTPSDAAVDDDLDPELLLVIGAHGLEQPVERPVARRPLGVLLEPALGALEGGQRRVGRELLRGAARGSSRGRPPSRGPGRWRRRAPRTRRRGATAARARRAAPRPRPGAGSEPRSRRTASRARPGRAHDRRAARREHALVVGGVAPVERLGDGEADHRVPEELQPLVVAPRGVGVLVEPAAVDERLREQVAITDRKPEALRQRVGRVHLAPGRTPLGRVLVDVVDGVLRRSGSSRRPRRRSRSRTPPRGS